MTLSLSDENFGKLVSGKTKAQNLFMSGKLKVKGNVMKGKPIGTRSGDLFRGMAVMTDFFVLGNSDENGTHSCKGQSPGQAVNEMQGCCYGHYLIY